MQLKDIMTRSVEIIAADASLVDAARKMEEKGVGFLPVVEDGRVVGVITDRDITIRAVSRGLDPEQTTVEETMTQRIVSLPEVTNVEDATELMEQRRVRRLIITNETEALSGVVSLDKLSLYIGRYGVIGDEPFEGEANSATREFPVGFDPAAQAVARDEDDEDMAPIASDPSVTTEAEIVERDARDQTDPRKGPRSLLKQAGKARA
jgi:CBS domain-containing protein